MAWVKFFYYLRFYLLMDEEDVGEYRDFYNVGFSYLLEFVG
jgi:hypothetical protein